MEGVPGPLAMKPKVGSPTKGIEAAPPTPMDIEVVETTLAITPLTLPRVTEEEVQLIDHPILALLAQPAIVEVVDEEGPNMIGLPMILAMVEVLPTTTKLLAGKAIGEAVGEAAPSTPGSTITRVMASPKVGLLVGIFPMATIGSSSRPCGSIRFADQMLDPLLGRAIDYATQCLQLGAHLSGCINGSFLLISLMTSF